MPVEDQGVFPERYQIIPRVLIFATRGEDILLLKGAPNKRLWANLYNGVGGHIEQGENVLSAAKREFKEETGLELINPWLCAVVMIDTGKPIGIGMYVFRGETSGETLQPSDEGNLEWVPQDKIHDLPLVEDLPILLPKTLSLSPDGFPLFAQYYYDERDNLVIEFS